MDMEQLLEIGQIVNTYGIKGFVKVVPFTDDITRFENLKKVYLQTKKGLETIEIEEVKYSKNTVLLKIKGIDDINTASLYKNCYLKIDRKDAVKLPEDSYFIVDLLDMEVYTDENIYLGKIDDVYPTGSNDIYVIKNEAGKQILLPAIAQVIKTVNVEDKKMTVHLLDGLI
jgi:16S rRNA processing protein RimM